MSQATGAPVEVVLLHGWLMGPDLWSDQVARLEESARCLAVRQPAHGSPAPPEGFTMQAWADRLLKELDDAGLGRVVLVGHSMGGMLAQEVWRRHPERVRALVLVGIGDEAWPPEVAEQFVGLADMVATSWGPDLARICAELLVGPKFLADHPDYIATFQRRVGEEYDLPGMRSLGRAIAAHDDYRASSATVTVPALLIHGTDDGAVPVDASQSAASRIPGARLVEVADAGHAVPMEQPGAVSSALVDFIRSL